MYQEQLGAWGVLHNSKGHEVLWYYELKNVLRLAQCAFVKVEMLFVGLSLKKSASKQVKDIREEEPC